MPYTKRIVCLANSFKTGRFCVAGREITPRGSGPWIRPVSDRPEGTSLLARRRSVRMDSSRDCSKLSMFPLLKPQPRRHQKENHLINSSAPWVRHGILPFQELHRLAKNPATLRTDSDHTSTGAYNCTSAVEAARYWSSLVLVRSSKFTLETTEKGDGTLSFRNILPPGRTIYKMNVTDPRVTYRYSNYPADRYKSEDVFLTISLTEPFDLDHRCHKLIVAVISNPPL